MKVNSVVKLILATSLISSAIIPFSGYVFFLVLFFFLLIKGELKNIFNVLLKERLTLYIFLLSMFSIIISDYKIDTLIGVGVILISIFVYLVIREYVHSIYDTIDIFKFFIISNIIISIYGIIQFYFIRDVFFSPGWIDSNIYNISMRAYSTLLNPNVLAGYLVFCICFQITCLENIRFKIINIISIALSSFCLILTYSRGAWITLFIAVFFMFVYRKKIIYLIYSLIFFISLVIVSGNSGIERLSLSKSMHDHSLHYRIEIYRSAFKIIKDHFLFGTGLNTMQHYINDYSQIINSAVYHAHNIILNIFCELGFIGLIVFVIILIKLIKDFLFIYKLEKSIYKEIAASSILSFLSIFIHGLIDATILAPQYLFFVIFIFSLVINIKHNNIFAAETT